MPVAVKTFDDAVIQRFTASGSWGTQPLSTRVAELAGVAATVLARTWRRNLLLSITAGTATCLILTNWLLPA